MQTYSFANILLSGPCNLACPACIGKRLGASALPSNLDMFPLVGLDRFLELQRTHHVRELSLTATNTEPQLYRHESRLISLVRERLPHVRLSLHTNGTRVLRKLETFNLYDRATLSVPSLRPETCLAMTGSERVLDLEAILQRSTIPIKVSTLVTDDNRAEIPWLLDRFRAAGVRRVVLRRPWQDTGAFDPLPELPVHHYFAHNPVLLYHDLEITVWDFHRTDLPCFNLFSDGTITDGYTLAGDSHGRC